MKETILVTGASGFIGAHLIRLLREQKKQIRAFILPGDSIPAWKEPFQKNLRFGHKDYPIIKPNENFEIHYGDIRNQDDVSRVVKGCDWVFHLAAISHLWVKNPNLYDEVNVEGTRNICDAAQKHGVKKLIYTSSAETIDRHKGGSIADECFRLSEKQAWGPYTKSKIRAEQIVSDYIKKELFAVITHPTVPIGPGDRSPTPPGGMIQMILNKKIKYYYQTGLNLVHVVDVAKGHLLAAQRGRSGEHYILGGTNLSFTDLFSKIKSLTGLPIPKNTISYRTAYLASCFMELWSNWVTHRRPVSTREGIRSAKIPFYFTSEKTKRALGYNPSQIDRALKDVMRYFSKT